MDTNLTFDEYLKVKKIDAEAFKIAETEKYAAWQLIFNELNPESFTMQKKFLINNIRRKYPIEI